MHGHFICYVIYNILKIGFLKANTLNLKISIKIIHENFLELNFLQNMINQ